MKTFRLAALTTAALLAGCSLIPAYQQPAAPVAAKFSGDTSTDAAGASTPVAGLGWREVFTDPSLQRVIEMSLANNRDLRVAVLNIEKARRTSWRSRRQSVRAYSGNPSTSSPKPFI